MENIVSFPDKNAIEEEASRWIVRFEGDRPPGEQDIAELKEWLSRSPIHREILLRLASSWNAMDLLSELVIPAEKREKPRINGFNSFIMWLLAPVMLVTAVVLRLGQYWRGLSSRAVWAATVVVAGVGFALMSWVVFDTASPANAVYATSVGESSTHILADGTTLRLNTNSNVEVAYTQNKRNIILRRGEAHFDVTPDPQRPFEVYAGTRMVRAVGTAFSVYLDKNNVKVMVTEGKVDLAAVKSNTAPAILSEPESGGSDRDAVSQKHQVKPSSANRPQLHAQITQALGSLVAGQSVIIPADYNGTIEPLINYEQRELARRLAWLEGQLVFAGEPLHEVVKEVSRYTPIHIEITDPELKNMRIGGQFQVGEVEALFDVLESGFGVEVTRLNDRRVQIHEKR